MLLHRYRFHTCSGNMSRSTAFALDNLNAPVWFDTGVVEIVDAQDTLLVDDNGE